MEAKNSKILVSRAEGHRKKFKAQISTKIKFSSQIFVEENYKKPKSISEKILENLKLRSKKFLSQILPEGKNLEPLISRKKF